jgi:hypothetical protein
MRHVGTMIVIACIALTLGFVAPAALVRPVPRRGDGAAGTFIVQLEPGLTHAWSYQVLAQPLPTAEAGALVINDLLADNKTIIADPAGEYDDWVELYNRGADPIALSGYYLSDKADDPLAYALSDTTLAPGGYYLVWCDNDPEQGPDHAAFKLNLDGEQVLLSTEAATVDAISFGLQETDVSYGRTTDGADTWARCTVPSPRRANACAGGTSPTVTAPPPSTGPPTITPTASRTPTGPSPTPRPPTDIYLPVTDAGRR